jgi:hypothetical protein
VSAAALGIVSAALAVAACGDEKKTATTPSTTPGSLATGRLPCSDEKVKLDPADFTTKVDNPYFPLAKGTRWSYRGADKEGTKSTGAVTATGQTKRIAGITASALVDRNTEDGKLAEEATEWYAQDKDGNVWYLGEDVKEYENRKVTARDSSLVGNSPLQAGVTMLGKPIPGSCHRLSYEKGESEDRLAVLSTRDRVSVPAGRYTKVVKLKQTTPLEPDAIEHRYYARGVGLVLVRAVSGEGERVELVRFRPAR